MYYTAKFRERLSPRVAGQLLCLRLLTGRYVSSGTSWKISVTVCPFVQILDLLVPQTVDYVADALQILDCPMGEQAIDVPKISCCPCPSRSPVPEPQVNGTVGGSSDRIVSFAHRGADRSAFQFLVVVARRRVQGSLPGQSTTATPSSGKRISKRIEEQSVDTSLGGGLGAGYRPPLLVLQMRILLCFSHFSPKQKKWEAGFALESERVPASVSSSTLAAQLEDAPVSVSGPIRPASVNPEVWQSHSLLISRRRTLRSSGGRMMRRREGGRGRRRKKEEEEEEEKEDVSVTGCRLTGTGIALVRQWIPLHTSVLFMLLVDIHFFAPLYLTVTRLVLVLPEENDCWIFPGNDFVGFPYSCWFNIGYMFSSVYGGFWCTSRPAALVVDIGSGMCWLVLLVTIRHMLCSCFSVDWCRARRRHWPRCVLAGFAGHDTSHAMFPSIVGCRRQQWHGWYSASVFPWLSAGPRILLAGQCACVARRRYVQTVLLFPWIVRSTTVAWLVGLAGSVASRAILAVCVLTVGRPKVFGCGDDCPSRCALFLAGRPMTVLGCHGSCSCSSSSRTVVFPAVAAVRCPGDWLCWSGQCSLDALVVWAAHDFDDELWFF